MALDNIGQIISAGFEEGQLALLNSGGFPLGLAGTLSAGSSVGLYNVRGVRTANPSLPQPEKTTVMGNNRALGTFLWKPGDYPEFDMDVAVGDLDLTAASENVLVRDLDKWSLRVLGGDELTYQDIMLLLSTEAQSKATGSDGQSLWYHLLIPRAKMAYIGPQGLNMRGENIFRYHVITRSTDKYPWGEAFAADTEGVTGGVMLEWTSEHRLSMDTILLEAATAQITLSHTPAMDTVTAGSGILFYVDGTEVALTGVTPSTKVATFTADEGYAGKYGVCIYERAA
jgi:hypothetical protein